MRLIDADALKKLLLKEGAVEDSIIVRMVNSIKTIDPVKHGRWEIDKKHLFQRRCSNCMSYVELYDARLYCLNCGSKMDKEVSE